MTADNLPTGRFRVRLTPEGWVFVVILCFVTVSAILRNVNLLIVLSGMMIAALLLSWRCQVHLLKSLRTRRSVPQHVHAGDLVNLMWECRNASRRLTAWNVNVTDWLWRADSQGREGVLGWQLFRRQRGKSRAIVHFPQVLPGQSMFASYKTMFSTRGTYAIGHAEVTTLFPFALLKGTRPVDTTKTIVVAPRMGTLSPHWDQRLQAIAAGNEALKRRRGLEEDEFYALRRWRAGDNFRHIHWRTTAKYGRPMVKQFDQPSNRDLAIMLDLYSPTPQTAQDIHLDEPENWVLRCETALSFAATVVTKLKNEVLGQVALGVVGESNETVVDRFHPELVAQVMRVLARARAGPQGALGPVCLQLLNSVSGGTPVYVISSRPQPERLESWGVPQSELARIRPVLRWLEVGSEQFENLFINHCEDSVRRMNQLQQSWMSDVSG